jgi:hypothetical protein
LTQSILRMLDDMLSICGQLGEELEMVQIGDPNLCLWCLQEDLGALPLRQRQAAVKQKLDLLESVRSHCTAFPGLFLLPCRSGTSECRS